MVKAEAVLTAALMFLTTFVATNAAATNATNAANATNATNAPNAANAPNARSPSVLATNATNATNAANAPNARSPFVFLPIAAKIASGLIGAVKAGSSVKETINSFQSMDYKVKYMVEIENLSDQPLHLVRSEVHSGYVNAPPPPAILPGKGPLYTKLPLMNCSTN